MPGQQPQDGAQRHALAAARLADEAEHAAPGHLETDPVDGLDEAAGSGDLHA